MYPGYQIIQYKCPLFSSFQDVRQVGDNFTKFYCLKTMEGTTAKYRTPLSDYLWM
jgi:hypothetical protein